MTTPSNKELDERITTLMAVIREVRRERGSVEEGTYHRVIAVDLHTYERLLHRVRDSRPVQPIIIIEPDPPIMRVMGETIIPAVGFGILVLDTEQITPVLASIRQGSETVRELDRQAVEATTRAARTRPISTGKRTVDL